MNLKELNKLSAEYLKLHWQNGGTSEFDQSINEISRAKITALKNELGDCWLFKINRYDEDRNKPYLVQFKGQKIYNFEYAAAVPVYNKELLSLLVEYCHNSGFKEGTIWGKIEAIQDKIQELNGINLIWS